MRKLMGSWMTVTAMAIAVFVFVLLNSAIGTKETQAQAGNPVWGFVDKVVPSSANLDGVYMQDENTAWLVGSNGNPGEPVGRVYKIAWRDGTWVLDATYSFRAPLHAIVAISDDNVWAVGDKRLIVHKDASGWQEIPEDIGLVEDSNYTTIQMFGNGEEGWAAGNTKPQTERLSFFAQLKSGKVQGVHSSGGRDTVLINSLHFADGEGWAVGGDTIWRFVDDDPGFPEWRVEAIIPSCERGFGCGHDLVAVRAINSEEAWAVGAAEVIGIVPSGSVGVIYHRIKGQWQEVTVALPGWGNSLRGISFSNDGLGLAVGGYVTDLGGTAYPLIISYRQDGKWHNEIIPRVPGGWLTAVSQVDSGHALAVGGPGLVLSYGYGTGSPVPTMTPDTRPTPFYVPLPSEKVADPHDPQVTYFANAGHTLRGGFRDYWNAHGGIEQFGYPITEEFHEESPTDGKMYIVQYFERARFEWHPENIPPYEVLLGLLGRTITQGRENETPFLPAQAKNAGFVYFGASQHNMAPEFAKYWQDHGGLPVYGYPISEAFSEVSPTDGKAYLVQYFERNRLEYHPELPEAYRVSLGLLGVEVLRARGWMK